MKPKIAITAGDVNGIGTEIISKSLKVREIQESADYSIFGPADVISELQRTNDVETIDVGLIGVEYTPGKWSLASGETSPNVSSTAF